MTLVFTYIHRNATVDPKRWLLVLHCIIPAYSFGSVAPKWAIPPVLYVRLTLPENVAVLSSAD